MGKPSHAMHARADALTALCGFGHLLQNAKSLFDVAHGDITADGRGYLACVCGTPGSSASFPDAPRLTL